jgi:hypothetical protein
MKYKKILLIIIAILILSGAGYYFSGHNARPAVSSNSGTTNIPSSFSEGQCNGILLSEGKSAPTEYLFPSSLDSGKNDYPAGASSSQFLHYSSVPFNDGNRILRVYVDKSDYLGGCIDSFRMFIYDKKKGSSTFLADSSMITGGNYGGIFSPYAVSKNDDKIIVDGWMGDPGAGGSGVDLGYATISVIPSEAVKSDGSLNYTKIAERNAFFYYDFGKVVYVGEGDKTPDYSKPGPQTNSGAIIVYDISTGETTKLLEEHDTSYKITGIEEAKGSVYFEATKYTFSSDCPRQEDGQICAEKSVIDRNVSLPAPFKV